MLFLSAMLEASLFIYNKNNKASIQNWLGSAAWIKLFHCQFSAINDAGKSTTGGQILFLSGQVDDRTIQKYENEAKDKSRESWEKQLKLVEHILRQKIQDL
ncbi:hypothetical protein Scep_011108 [Stephania cephalantha]|uniref:Tr-type G domain-containing protein n=1 Tax=Stephania cephalantha TaxID=152367 RepID=A0AAP0PEV4_9MAGN